MLLMFISVLAIGGVQAQKVKTGRLNKQIQQIEKDIAYTRTLIKQTKKNKTASLAQVSLLDKQIAKQQSLLSALQKEIDNTDKKISQNKLSIAYKNREIDTLKQEYARMLVHTQKNRSQFDRLMFVFASKDFNQAYKRLKYFEQYSSYRKKQIGIIMQKQDSLRATTNRLSLLKQDKEQLMQKEREQQIQIAAQKREMQQKVSGLKKREKQLRKQLGKHNRRKKQLKNKVQAILAAEARKAKKTKATPEQLHLSSTFEQNKGRLPWPVAKGVLYSSFGRHTHPVFKSVQTRNDGIDILTDKGQDARAVFEGEVRNIISVPGTSFFAVLVKHGAYFTLYSNLEQVYVKPGQQVVVKQKIGSIAQDPNDKTTKLQFQVWKNTSKLNPSSWLLRHRK